MQASRDGRRAGSSRQGRRHLHLNFMLVLVVAALSAWLPSVADATSSTGYVAMGDSYTAGPGITPPSPTAPPGCAQSEANYPHLIASVLKLSLTDVSCSGAKTENFTVPQVVPGGANPPQFDALTPSTKVVTVGMGGNDGNLFGTLLVGCTTLDAGQPNVGAPCQEHYEGFVTKTREEDIPIQEAALREIHKLSPKAKVYVVGYPEITPVNGYCPTAIPWTSGDLKWFNIDVQRRGNAALASEAFKNGAIYVDTFTPSIGHNACEAVGTRWIEPLIGSLTGVAVHPNALGQKHDAIDVGLTMLLTGVL
jgi:GDSL-like Lipase/Acylhydrolase family